jgi:NAD(P)H-quinone oxidoreductase subunit 5
MHAGIINAGGFLIVRLSPLVSLAPAALNILAIVGALSAVIASLVMMTQTSIKRSLAWSTVSQMGFMMLQCGLGAFALAVLHIVAHSLYKSYAFLSSGSVLALAKAAWTPSGRPSAHPALLVFILSVAVSLTVTVGHLFGIHFTSDPGLIVLASVFMMALAFMLWNLWSTRFPSRLATWGVLAAALTACAWFAAHHFALSLLSGALPSYQPERSFPELAVLGGIVLLFMAVLIFQACLPSLATRPSFRRLYVHASNGFYIGTLAHRLTRRCLSPRPL